MIYPIVVGGQSIGSMTFQPGGNASIKIKTGPDLMLWADPQIKYTSITNNQFDEYQFAPILFGIGAKYGRVNTSGNNVRKRTANCGTPTHVGKSRITVDTIDVYQKEVYVKQCIDAFVNCFRYIRGRGNDVNSIWATPEMQALFGLALQQLDVELGNDNHKLLHYANHPLLATQNSARAFGKYGTKEEDWVDFYTMLTDTTGEKGFWTQLYEAVTNGVPAYQYQFVVDGNGELNYTDPMDIFTGISNLVDITTQTDLDTYGVGMPEAWFDVSRSVWDICEAYQRTAYGGFNPDVWAQQQLMAPNAIAGGTFNVMKFGRLVLRLRSDHEHFARQIGKKVHFAVINRAGNSVIGSDLISGSEMLDPYQTAELKMFQNADDEDLGIVKVSARYEIGAKIPRIDLGGGAIKFY